MRSRVVRLDLRRLGSSREFLKHSVLVVAASAAVGVFGYAFHVVLSRRLGVADYGALSSILAAVAVSTMPASIIQTIAVKYAAEFQALGETAKLRALAHRLVAWMAIVALLIVAAGAAGGALVARFLQIGDARSVVVAFVVIACGFVSASARGVLQGTQDFGPFAASTSLEAVLKASLGVALAVLGLGMLGALFGYALATMATALYTVWAIRRLAFARDGAPARLVLDCRRLLQTSGGVAVAGLAVAVLTNADVVLVKHFFSAQTAGLFSAVALIGKALIFVVSFVPTVILPKAASRVAKNVSPLGLLVQALIASLGISGGVLVILHTAPELVIRGVTGARFVAGAGYLFPYATAMTMLATACVLITYRIGTHRFEFVAPLAMVAIGEIVAISLAHASVDQVITVLLLGHAAALAVCLYRLDLAVPMSARSEVTNVA